MSDTQFTRRRLLQAAGGMALVSGVSAPAIVRAETADIIKIGHLTPRTGFLGPKSTLLKTLIGIAPASKGRSGLRTPN
jgi:branched-chain amino acid transport system substrate-binding protein